MGDISTLFSLKNRAYRQKLNRKILKVTHSINQMILTDIYRTFQPDTKEYNFFSTLPTTFSKIDHILSHKASFKRYKNIKIICYILSDHHGLKLDFNKRNSRKTSNSWKLNTSVLNNHCVR